ncbi:MAG TPA: protease complex subunit PrcB family protein, partial [Pyrinomonadaceae bacterium]
VLATGYNSRYEGTRLVSLLTNQSEWSSVWGLIGRGSSAPMPEVNFNTRAVVLVYQGRKNTGGYGISVAEIRREGTTLTVRVNEQRPKPGDVVTDALTSPFVAVSIPRPPDGTIVKFDDEVNKIEQNRNVNERSYPPSRRQRRGRRG